MRCCRLSKVEVIVRVRPFLYALNFEKEVEKIASFRLGGKGGYVFGIGIEAGKSYKQTTDYDLTDCKIEDISHGNFLEDYIDENLSRFIESNRHKIKYVVSPNGVDSPNKARKLIRVQPLMVLWEMALKPILRFR
jgi:hypothetical protein